MKLCSYNANACLARGPYYLVSALC